MSRGPKITPEVHSEIIKVNYLYPKWTAKEVRNEVERRLKDKKRGYPKGWPSANAVSKKLQELRHPPADPLDRPWTTASLPMYPIPPEALPTVLKAWALCQEPERQVEAKTIHGSSIIDLPNWRLCNDLHGRYLTIREALWVGRLFHVIKRKQEEPTWEYLDNLLAYAYDFSITEKVLEGKPYPEERDMTYYWLQDSGLYRGIYDDDDKSDEVMPLPETISDRLAPPLPGEIEARKRRQED